MLSLNEQLTHANGTYFALIPSGDSRVRILELMEKYKIPNPVEVMKLHATVIYSKKPCPDMQKYQPDLPMYGYGYEFELFGEQKNVLVLRIASVMVDRLYGDLQAYGPTSDYPEFKFHLTLSYNFTGECPKADYQWNIPIKFDNYLCAPLED